MYSILVQTAELLLVLVNLIEFHAIILYLKMHMHKVEMMFKSTEFTTTLKKRKQQSTDLSGKQN